MDHFLLGSHVAQQSRRERLRFHPPEPTMVELNEVGLSNPYYNDPPGPLLDFGPPHNTLVGYDDVPSSSMLDVGGSNLAFLSGYNNNCYGSEGLSLSLSTSVVAFGSDGVVGEVHEPSSSNTLALYPYPSVCYRASSSGSRNPETFTQCLPSNGDVDNRFVGGPLGPFTGYAAILKGSRFLEPAQQLLDEMFGAVTGIKQLSSVPCGWRSGGSSSSSLGGSSWGSAEAVGGCYGREFSHQKMQHKKSMLLVMQGEVWKKYKQYHQQMKMAMSSFESVSGLNASMPFSSLALKNVSKHFRFLRNVISEQLLNISKVLGEELVLSPAAIQTEVVATPALKFMDETLKKQSENSNGLGFLGNNQPAWRPQRGLPERAVAVLRAWLFDHFLHPYPTDTEKLMLASQTGLSRNQVSNWFINARVRVWKPLVEEIHKLENNMVTSLNSSKSETISGGEIAIDNEARQIAVPSHHVKHTDCCGSDWQAGQRPRTEHCSIVEGFDGGIVGYSPYQGGFNMAELGGVSLTLGLRLEEGSQQQLRPYYGSNLVQEFVG